MKAPRASVRMYCQGFGDCFLLTFASERGPFRVLIDCGVVRNTKDERARMIEVVEDVLKETEGVLDVVVVTHEHWDHVCGFGYAADLWKKFKIRELWLPWTEDPMDPVAKGIAKYHRDAFALARRAETALRGVSEEFERHGRLTSLLNLLPAYSEGTGNSIAAIVSAAKASGAEVRYLKPGDAVNVGNFHAAALGPPRDEKKLRDLLGGKGDTFGNLAALAEDAGLPAAVSYEERLRQALGLAPPPGPPSPPFAPTYVLMPDDEPRWARYAQGKPPGIRVDERYKRDEWRRIDAEGLATFGRLAMQLDSLTNNLSLALAFVVGDDVLVFPGDAQIGNWKSWGDQTYSIGPKEWTVTDLMRRVRVYKAGHHASENGTCRPERFDLMPNDMISLVTFDAVKQWPSIPQRSLIHALERRGPVARVDRAGSVGPPFAKGPVSGLTGRPLYVEVDV